MSVPASAAADEGYEFNAIVLMEAGLRVLVSRDQLAIYFDRDGTITQAKVLDQVRKRWAASDVDLFAIHHNLHDGR